MTDILDVSKYILNKHGEMTAMKLQKLTYYCQAWSLVWDEKPLFKDWFEAWANGPVSPRLYDTHRGAFLVNEQMYERASAESLDKAQRETVEAVLLVLGDKTAQWLSDLTHSESPWVDARGEIPPMGRCDKVITTAAMHEYYSSIQ